MQLTEATTLGLRSAFALGAAVLVSALLFPLVSLAQGATPPPPPPPDDFEGCHKYKSLTGLPSGFGAPVNVFTANNALMMRSRCTDEGFLGYVDTSSVVARGVAVYKLGYRWNGTAWVQFEYKPADGSALAADTSWIMQTAVSKEELPLVGANTYWLSYMCVRNNGDWKCGCRDATCAKSMWNMPGAVKSGTTTPPSGTSTTLTASTLTLAATPSQIEYSVKGVAATSSASTTNIIGGTEQNAAKMVTLNAKNTSRTLTLKTENAEPTLQYKDHCSNTWKAWPTNVVEPARAPAPPHPSAYIWKPGETKKFTRSILSVNTAQAQQFLNSLRWPAQLRFTITAHDQAKPASKRTFASNTFALARPGCTVAPAVGAPTAADICSPLPPACPAAR